MTSRPARVAARVVALALVFVVVALTSTLATFRHSERAVTIGAHQATVRPTFSGYATVDFGPLLPRMRIPLDKPLHLGIAIDLGDSDVTSLDQLAARDAVIASQPEGEIQTISDSVVGMLRDAALRGLGVGSVAVIGCVLVWRGVGADRRRLLLLAARHPTRKQALVGTGTAVALVASLVLTVVPELGDSSADGRPTTWEKARTALPSLPADPVLDKLELAQGAAGRSGIAIVKGALNTYRASVSFYGTLADKAATTTLRRPDKGQTTAIVVTDRHDNIGMDPVAREIARRAGATMMLDLGDDTSVGGSWEQFSINSLAREFRGVDVVSVAGNHDTGTTVRRQMVDKGFHLLKDEVDTVDGITFLGQSDPRSSGLTSGYDGNESDNIAAIHEQDDRLTKKACAAGHVAVVMVHSPSSAKKLAASGCADLVLSGHLHRQVGPVTQTGANGDLTTSLTTGSTGGAVYAFALGSKLRREAQTTIVTFEDGRPVGLQIVSFEPGGSIQVAPYHPVATSPNG